MGILSPTDLFVPTWLDGWTTTSLEEVVNRVGTAGYQEWTAKVREVTNNVYLDWSGWSRVTQWPVMEAQVATSWRRAWADGIKEFGLTLDDMTAEELLALNAQIMDDQNQVRGYVEWVDANRASYEISHIQDGRQTSWTEWTRQAFALDRWKKVEARMRVWWNSYHRVQNMARQLAAGDRPMEWVLGPTEHCTSCSNYAGRVYRASTWLKYGIRPQMPSLECGGFN